MTDLSDLEKDYDLEFDRVIREIKKQKAKKVLIQLPDGLKPVATDIVDRLKSELGKVEFFIYLNTCFGACDIPTEVEKFGIDMIVQFGHSDWNFKNKKNIKVLK